MLFSYTTIIIITTCIVSFISFINDSLKNDLLFSPYDYSNNKKWWILLTHGFIHADFLHLFFNMYVLYIFGPSLESYFLSSSEVGWIYLARIGPEYWAFTVDTSGRKEWVAAGNATDVDMSNIYNKDECDDRFLPMNLNTLPPLS